MNANILLALLLGLQNIELSDNLKQELKKFSDKLYYNHNNPDAIIVNLNTILDTNSDLNQAYHAAKMELDSITISSYLLPKQSELEKFTYYSGIRGFHPGDDDGKSDEIENTMMLVSMLVLNNPEPEQTSKTLLQRLRDFINNKENDIN